MDCEITCVLHNCFLLQLDSRLLLFDYPSPPHRTAEAEALVLERIRDADLTVLISHSHADHFSPDVFSFGQLTRSIRFVLSWDVAELCPEFNRVAGLPHLILEPDECAILGDLRIETVESSDLGVGFLLNCAGKSVYFGGDVAAWCQETLPPRAREAEERQYLALLERLARDPIDLAFSNADKRLPNWTGAFEFLRIVRPRYFVPMHCFGHLEQIAEFAALVPTDDAVTVLRYERPGQVLRIAL